MMKNTFCFRGLKSWLFMLLFGAMFITSLAPLEVPQNNVTLNTAQRTRRGSADTQESRRVLNTSHLSALTDLLSDRKITVRLSLQVSLTGPDEILESQMRLLLRKNCDIYNTGQKSGLFTMRVVRLKKASAQRFHHQPPAVPQE